MYPFLLTGFEVAVKKEQSNFMPLLDPSNLTVSEAEGSLHGS